MYAIFLGDCINRMCLWNKQQEVDDSSTIVGKINSCFEPPPDYETGQGRYEENSEIAATNPPRHNCAKSCLQEQQILALRRSNSAPPFKRKTQKLQISMP